MAYLYLMRPENKLHWKTVIDKHEQNPFRERVVNFYKMTASTPPSLPLLHLGAIISPETFISGKKYRGKKQRKPKTAAEPAASRVSNRMPW